MSAILRYPEVMRINGQPLYLLLSQHRVQARLSMRDAAEAIGLPQWKLFQLEQGFDIALQQSWAEGICRVYGLRTQALTDSGAKISADSSSRPSEQRSKAR